MAEPKHTDTSSHQEKPSTENVLGYIDSAIPEDAKASPGISHIPENHVQETLDWLWNFLYPPVADKTIVGVRSHRIILQADLEKVILKLSGEYQRLPTSLYVKGISCPDPTTLVTGSFADIHSGDWLGQRVALKRPLVDEKGSEFDKNLQRALCREALIWKQLNHEHILPFIGVNTEVFKSSMCLVLPWMENGNIRGYVQKIRDRDKLSGSEFVSSVNKWLHQVALGLAYLHDHSIVHGDINGENILVDDNGMVRLTHPGLGVINEATPRKYASKHKVAFQYRAPELFEPEAFGLELPTPTFASDIYAFACTCVEVYSETLPFNDTPLYPLARSVVSGKRPKRPKTPDGDAIPDTMWHITQRCWTQRPSERPSAKDVAAEIETFLAGKDVKRPKFQRALNPIKIPVSLDRLKNSLKSPKPKFDREEDGR